MPSLDSSNTNQPNSNNQQQPLNITRFDTIWPFALECADNDPKQALRLLLAAVEIITTKESNIHATV